MRQSTWEGIGTDVTGLKSVDAVLTQSGLDYSVRKRPLKRYDSRLRRNTLLPEGVSRRFYTERTSDGHIYDVVSDRYHVVQNREAFDFVGYMSDDLMFEKAGELESGLVYIIGRLPDCDILGDRFTPHVIFSNDFGGKSSIRAAICPLRVVCQNQFATAFRDTGNAVSVRHTAAAKAKLKEAREVLKKTSEYMERLNRMAEGYAAMKVGPRQTGMILDAMFPVPENASETLKKNIAARKAKFEAEFAAACASPDNYVFRGTAWGLINAYTDIITHSPVKGRTSLESRFEKVTFGSDTAKFLKLVDRIAV